MTEDSVYQAHLYRSLTDKYSNMSRHLDKVINEANSQINGLQQKIACRHDPYRDACHAVRCADRL